MSSANAVPQQPSGGQTVRARDFWHRNKSRAGEPYHSRYLPRGVSAQEVHHHSTSSSPSEGSTLKPAAAPPAPLRAPERRRRRPPEGPAPITPGCAALQLPAPLGANRGGHRDAARVPQRGENEEGGDSSRLTQPRPSLPPSPQSAPAANGPAPPLPASAARRARHRAPGSGRGGGGS